MCFFRRPKQPKALPSPPPISGRVDVGDDKKPALRELFDEDDKESAKNVEYGSSKKSAQRSATKKGTSALRIPLNTGTTTSASGGLNVPG